MIAISNVIATLLLMFLSNYVAKVSFISGHLIVPGVIMLVFMGAWLGGSSMGDWATCLGMGVLGTVMKAARWPRPPLILALILSNILENAYQISNQAYDHFSWLGRPIVLVLLALTVLMLIHSAWSARKASRSSGPQPATSSETGEQYPILSLPFAIALLGVFALAALQSLEWPQQVRQFPIVIAVPGIVLTLFALSADARDLARLRATAGSLWEVVRQNVDQAIAIPTVRFLGYLLAMVLGAVVVGQKIAIPLFVYFYLRRWGRFNLVTSLGYAAFCWIFLVVFYDWGMSLLFHYSILQTNFGEYIPAFIPKRLIF
jgi:hypothetical protein